MKIIQTFWTAGQDPLKHSFGWTHPEYNLMSWALSSLSLREHYDEVELYTDSAGYNILVEVLNMYYGIQGYKQTANHKCRVHNSIQK